jgi:hypothetical protein
MSMKSNEEEIRASLKRSLNDLRSNDTQIVDMNLQFDKLEYNMFNEDYTPFATFNMTEMILSFQAFETIVYDENAVKIKMRDNRYSHLVKLQVGKLIIKEAEDRNILIESEGALEGGITILSEKSHMYKGDPFNVDLKAEKAIGNFVPETVQKIMTFFKRFGYEGSEEGRVNKLNKNEERKQENELNDEENTESENTKNIDVLASKQVLKVTIDISEINLGLLHPTNFKPFVFIKGINYLYTHQLMQGYHLMNITFDDMPFYCNSPFYGQFDLIRFHDKELNELMKEENEFVTPFKFRCEINDIKILKPGETIKNKVYVEFNNLKLNYAHETIMRVKDYFFDQFLNALTEPYRSAEDIRKIWDTRRSVQSENMNVDLSETELDQEELYTQVEIFINKPKIYLKDTPSSNNHFIFE